jgi:rhomboid family GlyGly-CTERM serine protease
MPRDDANPVSRLAATLQWDRGRWRWLLLILLTLDLVLGLGDSIGAVLRYDRGAVADGGWWRLLTAHGVHLDAHHLILNQLGLVLVWALFAEDYDPVEWLVIVLAGALAISSGLWWWSPRVVWYVGASGVLHSVMAAGAAKHLLEREWDRWLLLGGLAAKLAYEQLGGREPPSVVVDAHLYGALCGFVVGAALHGRMAIIRHRHQP